MANNYRESGMGNLKIVGGAIAKYASLLTGIYSVCKDEQDFMLATSAGCAYLAGEILQRFGMSDNDHQKFSKLEKTLKKG